MPGCRTSPGEALWSYWLVLLGLVAPANPPAATAPFPLGWQTEYDEENEDDYIRPRPVRGIYGHGVFESGNSIFTNSSDPTLCKGDEGARAALSERAGRDFGEFWIYATAHQVVLFRRYLHVDSSKPCAEALSFKYRVERGFAADGMVHQFYFVQRKLEDIDTLPVTPVEPNYFHLRDPLYNALARIPPPKRRRLVSRRRTVAGLPAQCWGYASLVYYEVCFSASAGRSKGMILSTTSGDDEGSEDSMHFDRLDESTLLDGRLFEMERDWWFAAK